MSGLPDPLTPACCDLTDFQYMELDVRRLRDSKFAATPNSDAFRAGVILWCAAWHQVPAGSLPDDDTELANLAGYGRMPISVKEWKKVRDEALHGFVKCSDGRLYHSIIAEKALSAYGAKLKHAYDKFCDRMRKENSRRAKEQQPALGIPTFEQWNSGEYLNGIPPEAPKIPPEMKESSGGIPPENPLRGNREGTEQNGEGDLLKASVPIGTGDKSPGSVDNFSDQIPEKPKKTPEELTKDEIWRSGKSLLMQAEMPRAQCGTYLGKLVKDHTPLVVLEAVRIAVVERPADPASFLRATCQRLVGERKSPQQIEQERIKSQSDEMFRKTQEKLAEYAKPVSGPTPEQRAAALQAARSKKGRDPP